MHSVIIRNEYDQRGTPPGNSQLTIDRFELDVPIIPQNSDTSTLLPQNSAAATTTTPSAASIISAPLSLMTVVSTIASSLVTSSESVNQQSKLQTDSVSQPSITFGNNFNVSGSAGPSAGVEPSTGASMATPVGGIIGGALGGLAAVAILIILIVWLRMKKKSTR
jgi:hypothetical protein